jgi:hypothetical protein
MVTLCPSVSIRVGPGICMFPPTPYPHMKILFPSVVIIEPADAVISNVVPVRPWIVA